MGARLVPQGQRSTAARSWTAGPSLLIRLLSGQSGARCPILRRRLDTTSVPARLGIVLSIQWQAAESATLLVLHVHRRQARPPSVHHRWVPPVSVYRIEVLDTTGYATRVPLTSAQQTSEHPTEDERSEENESDHALDGPRGAHPGQPAVTSRSASGANMLGRPTQNVASGPSDYTPIPGTPLATSPTGVGHRR